MTFTKNSIFGINRDPWSKEMMMETMNLKCSLSILCRGWLGMRQRCMARANVSTKKCV